MTVNPDLWRHPENGTQEAALANRKAEDLQLRLNFARTPLFFADYYAGLAQEKPDNPIYIRKAREQIQRVSEKLYGDLP
jgi:hypothetical protein